MTKSIRADIWDLLNADYVNAVRRKSGLAIAYTPPTEGDWFTLTLSTKADKPAPDGYQISGIRNAVLEVLKDGKPFRMKSSVVQQLVTTKYHHIRRIRFYVQMDV